MNVMMEVHPGSDHHRQYIHITPIWQVLRDIPATFEH
jgi:hypothetical protein